MVKILCAILVQFLFVSSAFALKLDDPAPPFSLKDSEGKNFELSDFVGAAKKENSNGVILSFFASWCIACRNELPLFNSLADELQGEGIKIVVIGLKEDFDTIGSLLADLKVRMPIVLSDRDGKVAEKYGVRYLPTTFFIGSDGKVKGVVFGEIKNESELREKAKKISK